MTKNSDEGLTSLIKCMQNRDVMGYTVAERSLTLDKAINGNTLTSLVKQHGEQNIIKAMYGALALVQEYFNLTTSMTESQTVQTVSMILDGYPAETMEDFILCLKNAKYNEYGKLYNRMDGQVVMEWFQKYLGQKYERLEQIKHNQKYQAMQDSEAAFSGISNTLLITQKAFNFGHATKDRIQRVTYEKHLKLFKETLSGLSLPSLKGLLEEYKNENDRYNTPQFDEYILALKQEITSRNEATHDALPHN